MFVPTYPAPWRLSGSGYMFRYIISDKERDNALSSESTVSDVRYKGPCTIIINDYRFTTAGPYRELSFIPGTFRRSGKKFNSITKSYVSEMEGVVNGAENWGIQRELADFNIEDMGWKRQKITVSQDGSLIAELTIRRHGFRFLKTTALRPFRLAQQKNDTVFYTALKASGRVRRARIESAAFNPDFFPDLSGHHPVYAAGFEEFTCTMPTAKTEKK